MYCKWFSVLYFYSISPDFHYILGHPAALHPENVTFGTFPLPRITAYVWRPVMSTPQASMEQCGLYPAASPRFLVLDPVAQMAGKPQG
jgi:hypothetical protein